MERFTFRSLSDAEQTNIIKKSESLKKERKVMGVFTFIKGDSVIFKSSQDHFGRKLLYKSPRNM